MPTFSKTNISEHETLKPHAVYTVITTAELKQTHKRLTYRPKTKADFQPPTISCWRALSTLQSFLFPSPYTHSIDFSLSIFHSVFLTNFITTIVQTPRLSVGHLIIFLKVALIKKSSYHHFTYDAFHTEIFASCFWHYMRAYKCMDGLTTGCDGNTLTDALHFRSFIIILKSAQSRRFAPFYASLWRQQAERLFSACNFAD